MRNFLSVWIPLAIAITCLAGLIYLTIQQDMRIGANDPQIQLAEDLAASLNSGVKMPAFISSIEISQSLAPFIMVFDTKGNLISGDAVLHRKAPTLPEGVLLYVKSKGEDRFTWQPETGVRLATIIISYNNGYVLAGRSLREIEKREDNLFMQVFLGWTTTLVISFLAAALFVKKK